jgi:TolA-binding protein
MVLVAVCLVCVGCAGAAEPAGRSPAQTPAPPPVDEPSTPPAAAAPAAVTTCVRPEAAAVLDACAAAGEAARAPLPLPEADGLGARADEAYRTSRWVECAELYGQLAQLHPEPAKRAEAAYAAVLCVNSRLEEAQPIESPDAIGPRRRATSSAAAPYRRRGQRPELDADAEEQAMRERLAPRPLTPSEVAMAQAYARYECIAPRGQDFVRIRYRRARVYYIANHWEEAAVLFRDVAFGHPADELAPYSANLFLDCLNVVARIEPGRSTRCRAELERSVEEMLSTEALLRDEELRHGLGTLQCGIWWQQAEGLRDAGRRLEAADLLLKIDSRHGDDCSQIGSHDVCELLYNAAIDSEAGGDAAKAIQVRRRLIAQCGDGSEHAAAHGGRASEWSKRATAQLGASYRAAGDHAAAAELLESFARHWPGEDEAINALEAATALRVGLGHDTEAIADMELFERNYGARREHKARVASVVFTAGQVHVRAKAWKRAERHYASFLKRYRDDARPDEVIRATAELGEARWKRAGSPANPAGLVEAREAAAMADAGGAPGEALEARLARYRAMVAGSGASQEVLAARLSLLLDAVARARTRLGVADPPEASIAASKGMPVDQAERVLLGL